MSWSFLRQKKYTQIREMCPICSDAPPGFKPEPKDIVACDHCGRAWKHWRGTWVRSRWNDRDARFR